MPAISSAIRWDVIVHLYSQLEHLPPGSERAEIIEHAIDLALSPRRLPKDHSPFLYDVWRNAQFSILRSQRRQATLHRSCGILGISSGNAFAVDEPEAVCCARDFVNRLRKAAKKLGPQVCRCLEGMLADEPIDETALACGSSRSSVDRMRKLIRSLARELREEDDR